MKKSAGQILVPAIILLVILAVALPALIYYIQNESTWTIKEQQTTRAFQMGEAAVEKGFQELISSSSTWANVQAGTIPTGYHLDQSYTGLTNGQFQICLAAGPGVQQATIIGVGRDTANKELRAIKAIYSGLGATGGAITSGRGTSLAASTNVEWGSVTSYNSITANGRLHPRFYSTGNIDLDSNGAAPPNTDNVQWWSYDPNIPPQPQIKLSYYKDAAQNAGTTPPAGCPASYLISGGVTFKGCIDQTGHTYYVTGDIDFQSGSGGNFILGNIVTEGNITISGNGGSANGITDTASIPPQAWQEYGNDWSSYQAYDPSAPATYALAASNNYTANLTYNLSGVLVHGFVYASGGQGLQGGGNGVIHGALYTPGTTTFTSSNFTVYFDTGVVANIQTTNVPLTRTSWQEITTCSWSSTNAACTGYCP